MAGQTTTYDPTQGSLAVGGALITNWNEVDTARDEDDVTTVASTTGHQAFVLNANQAGKITVRLPVFSQDNDIFSAFAIAKSQIQAGFADMSGTTRAFIPAGRVMKLADKTTAKDGTEVTEWSIIGDMPIYFVGGNNVSS